MKTLVKVIIAGAVVFTLLQIERPSIPSGPATAEIQAPPKVKRILEKNCYSCHSNERRLSWFDQVVPGYWLVRHDVLNAREHLNFSTLGSKPAAMQKASLYEAVNMVQLGTMPLPSFAKLHPEARVTAAELATLKAYLAPWTPAPNQSGSALPGRESKTPSSPASLPRGAPALVSLVSVKSELNASAFDGAFEGWKLLSSTDRGDNNTFRFILGNDVAMKAAQSGNISPWPDGTRFAKVAWQQELGEDGLIHPGKFVQVELMVKDARLYKNTNGWGWGRWRGLDLKPYGEDTNFVNECTGCHRPVRGNDYVYTLPITRAHANRLEVVNNSAAALPDGLPWQPFEWRPITMYVDRGTHTMATLYGNDAAMQFVNARGPVMNTHPALYPAGAVLALVTWTQREDPHWFGGRIPDAPKSVEFVAISHERKNDSYRSFSGKPFVERHLETESMAERMKFILGLGPARLP